MRRARLRHINPAPARSKNNDSPFQPELGMTYRSLLVLLDHDPLCAARTQVAISLARQLD